MKVGTKLSLSLAFPIVVVMGLFAYFDERRGQELLREELAREGRAIARTAQIAVEDYLRDGKLEEVRDLVERTTGYERVLGMRVFEPGGSILMQSAILEASPFTHVDALREALTMRHAVETRRLIGDEPVVTFIMPLDGRDGPPLGAVQVLQLESFMDDGVKAARNFTLTLTTVMILATGAILLIVTRLTVTRSVHDLVRSFREVGSGDLSARVPDRRRSDEFEHIAQEFNKMCERLEEAQQAFVEEQEMRRNTEAELRDAEKLASLGRVAAGLAHEIGTPLNVISGRAESLERELTGSEPAIRSLRIITGQIDRISRIVRGFLDFARARHPRLAPTDVSAVLRKVIELMEQQSGEAGVRVVLETPDEPATIRADAEQLYQVFLNLMTNAIDAMPDGGRLRIRLERCHGGNGSDPGAQGTLQVIIEDSGQGIPPEELRHVFEPFYTTKKVGKGTGLGLAVSYGIVGGHGGTIEVESEVGRGSRFTVSLPANRTAVKSAAG
jgi:signal transduction histidine kinase